MNMSLLGACLALSVVLGCGDGSPSGGAGTSGGGGSAGSSGGGGSAGSSGGGGSAGSSGGGAGSSGGGGSAGSSGGGAGSSGGGGSAGTSGGGAGSSGGGGAGDGGSGTAADPREAGTLRPLRGMQLQATGAMGRAIVVEITLPSTDGTTPATQGRPFPVVTLAHGASLDLTQYRSYADHLASWGYAVVAWNNPDSLFSYNHDTEASDLVGLTDWIAAPPPALSGLLDAQRIGASGHSLGGKLSLLAAGRTPRIKASFTLDPVDGAGGPGAAPDPARFPSAIASMGTLTIPVGMVGETLNATGGTFGMSCAPAAQNFQAFYAAARTPAYAYDVAGVDHMDFLDNPDCGLTCSLCTQGTADPRELQKLTRGLLVAFYEVHLRADDRLRAFLQAPATGALTVQTSMK